MRNQVRLLIGIAPVWTAVSSLLAVTDALCMGVKYSRAVKYLAVSGGFTDESFPKVVQLPIYPTEMVRAGISGDAWLAFVVTENGEMTYMMVERATQKMFGGAPAIAAAKWTFVSGKVGHDGKAVASPMRCRIDFRADESDDR